MFQLYSRADLEFLKEKVRKIFLRKQENFFPLAFDIKKPSKELSSICEIEGKHIPSSKGKVIIGGDNGIMVHYPCIRCDKESYNRSATEKEIDRYKKIASNL
jgi:hypothetical protein